MLRQVVALAVCGLAGGVPVAIVAAPVLRAMLFGVAPTDPVTIVISASIMFAVALAAGFLPAHRASRIEVLTALRHE